MGGYIMRQTKWLGTGDSGNDNDKRTRAQEILQRVANLLLDTNTGWVLDQEHNETSNPGDQTYLIGGYGNIGTYFLFFKNNNGVDPCEKLLIGYSVNGYYPQVPFGYPYNTNTACGTTTGLFCSMIPAGSTKSFGTDPSIEGFLVDEATKIHGSYNGNSVNNGYSVAYRNTGSTTYHAQIVTNGKTVVFRINKENYTGNMWFVGPVIETLAHPSMDIKCTSKMLSKHIIYGDYSEAVDDSNGYNNYDFWRSINSSYYNQYNRVDLFDSLGHHLHSSNGHGIFFTADGQLLTSLISNSSISGFNRWVAVSCGVYSPDPTTHYIVQGDGLKGYLDTNFIRNVLDGAYTIGQTFDDGNFVYVGNGIALGWDPSNGAFNG